MARRWGGLRYKIRAGSTRGVTGRVGILVNLYVSSCIATDGSSFLDAIGGICFIRFGTRRALAFGLATPSRFGGLAGDSRGSRGSPGASVYSYSDSEGGLFSEDECLWDFEWLMMCV